MTNIESNVTIFGQCYNLLNNNMRYRGHANWAYFKANMAAKLSKDLHDTNRTE